MIKRTLLLVIVIAAGGALSLTAFAVTPAPFFFGFNPASTFNFGADVTVASRVSFDPTSTITFTGATNTTAEISSERARLNFAALDFDKVIIEGIRIRNHGSTDTIASLEVIAPKDFLIDARSPPTSSDLLRKVSPNKFAVPIPGAVGSTPGVAEVKLEMMFWNSTAFVSTDKKFYPDMWSLMIGRLSNMIVNFKDAHALSTVTVHKFFDEDQDGAQDTGEVDLSGWLIKVFDSAGTTVVAEGTTDASGNVSFTLQEGNTYIIREVFPSLPPGCEGGQWIQTKPGAPTFEYTVVLTSAGATVEFGNALQCLVSIFKFFDEDGDGVHDLGEGGLQGWKIRVYDDTGTFLLQEKFTDSTGTATFVLEQGKSYIAREVIPAETSCPNIGQWTQTFPGPPSYEHSFFVPTDGGVSLKFGNKQECLTGVYVIELRVSSLD